MTYTGDLDERLGMIQFDIGGWQEFGYANPPAPDCATIPPLGQRSEKAVKSGHEAIEEIDALIRRLHEVREQLVGEIRRDDDIRTMRERVKKGTAQGGAGLWDR